jgi:hypothetical protein
MKVLRFIVLVAVLCFCKDAGAQLKILPQSQIDSIANPPLAANAGTMCFDKLLIDGVRMTQQDAPRVFEYGFVNSGSSELVITRLVSTCSCATATYDKRVVKPGERGVIRLTYNAKGRVGTNLQRVFVYTGDNTRPTAVLRLEVTTSSQH